MIDIIGRSQAALAGLGVKGWLLVALGGLGVWFVCYWWQRLTGDQPWHPAIGALTNFFDTLGIGSFATTTAIYKPRALVADEDIPGTLNVGHTLPTFAQAFFYITAVAVDPITLVMMIAASVLGSWLGAGVVSGWPRRRIQIGMGLALLVAAVLLGLKAGGVIDGLGGEALTLQGPRLWIGLFGNFVLGALMTLGIGLYGPCLVLVTLLGMAQKAAFPIMMGSCAFLMPVASARFIARGRYNARAAIGLALGGVPAVLAAAILVTSLTPKAVYGLVIVVVVYTAAMMLRSAWLEGRGPTAVTNVT
jgi:uncharacterized membrane protein YfcA